MILSIILSLLAIPSGVIFYLKWIATLIVIRLYKRFHRRRLDVYDINARKDPEKLGFLAPNIEIQLESPYPESHLVTAADEIFFYGVNSSSECLIARIARGGGGEAEAWIYLKLKDGRTYHLKETSGYERNLGERVFSCGGLQMSFEAPMRRWRIVYNGLLRWKASSDICDLTSDMHDSLTAKSIAKASWKVPFMPPINEIFDILIRFTGIPLTVKFSEEISQVPEISGGKGASLGKLTKLSEEDKTFVVPNGIVVTTSAYSEFLTREIEDEIRDLEDIAYGNVKGDVSKACEKVSAIVVRTSLPDKICNEIEKQLNTLFDNKINLHKFAVRSSATGEDTEQMSAAGQMDTFLGVHGLKEIFTSIKKCWASQFGYIAVEYKRRYGQPLNSPMAVVIQEMVACDVAGVLFTCDPLTSNPSLITITGNYGLGETVVSGSEEPDTVTLQRENGGVSIKNMTLGAKNRRIVMQGDGGVITEDVPEEAKDKCCIPEVMAIKLGKLAIKIEKYYKSPRDIEWGICDKDVYILQSRPVTSGALETDFEIKHEFDSPLRCELESFSKANVGEVLPGATSPLGIDLIFNYFRVVFQHEAKGRSVVNTFLWNNYFPSGMVHFYNQVFMMVADMLSRLGKPESLMSQGTMIGIFGRLLDDEETFQVAEERYEQIDKVAPMTLRKMIKNLFFGFAGSEKIKNHVTNFSFPTTELKNSREMFQTITKSFSEFNDAFEIHMRCSEGSMMWNMFLFNLLGKNKGRFDNDVYGDFARLLSSSSNVESADVPAAMKELARWIVQEKKSEEFKAMPVEDALKWLESSSSVAGYKFRMFLKRHGHRCLKEFDIRSKPWGDDPKSLIQLLQNLSASCEETSRKSDDSYDKIFSELNTPLGFKSRCLIRFLLPNCRRAVGEREQCKSMLIKAIDNWRKGFLHLGKLMVSEGRIPDHDFIFFLTLNELRELLETRSPKIMAKVIRRRKLHPTLDKYMFPEMVKGVPQPMNDETNMNFENVADLTMKGIPVSQGVTRGYARVALSLEEAAHLKPGEILITYSTDIGWSPYFPILSGVVTELGGLISHGAVVSREYGLPCVVGLHGATRQFQTGDFVLLDGNKGILQKLPKPEPSENIQS
ncbi:prodigiosin synthesizing transferase PigC-like [Uloborus diversus]|uniref:prodigiosin synthesizing transferase PigC-like n=1 Tax=Uloborus diversus TaxID=327109 RepID=UPI00240A713F|nr:prodigiosin synthesizing transferase PigC-like [Uloborus diversus]